MSMQLASCNNTTDSSTYNETDSTECEGYPTTFSSMSDVLLYKATLANDETADSVILNTPDLVLNSVCNVLVKQQKTFTKYDLATEYLSNYTIYDNVLNQSDINKLQKDTIITESVDTVINGKKCTITYYNNGPEILQSCFCPLLWG